MTKSTRFAAFAALLLTPLSSALAQGVQDLPHRPITRSEVVADIKRQFAQMDANHDGTISRAEFEAYRERQNAGPQSAPGSAAAIFGHVGSHWFDHADTNQDGRVTLQEAVERPLHLFDMADANHDGVVSLQEQQIATMMLSLGGK